MTHLFKNQRDGFLEITGELQTGRGEDCCLADDNANGFALAVFDGCGGIGSEQYGGPFQNHTGAYLASRTAAGAFRKWFSHDFLLDRIPLTFGNLPAVCQDVRRFLCEELEEAGRLVRSTPDADPVIRKGTMHKLLPTTASMIIGQYRESLLNLYYLWAGDSRGYLLNQRGMMQITLDDTSRELDAWDSLLEDQTLTNLLSASGGHLHGCFLSSELPLLVMAATDGCFDYLPTPMHLEYLILSSLMVSAEIEEWKEAIHSQLAEAAGDDYAMEIGVFGFPDFPSIKEYFRERERFLDSRLSCLSGEEQSRAEWNEYKEIYYRDEA